MASTISLSDKRQAPPLIQCLRLFKSYIKGRDVLRDVSVEVNKRDFILLTGPSRSGKTTFLKLLLGIEPPDRGHILFGGQSLQRMSPKDMPRFRRRTGVVFQDLKLLKHRTVFENVALPLEIAGKSGNLVKDKVLEILRMLGLDRKTGSKCDRLSTTEQQLTAIARAVVNDPVLLLMDEPAGKLDEETLYRVVELIGSIQVRGTTVIVVSSEWGLGEHNGNARLWTIRDSRVLEQEPLPHTQRQAVPTPRKA
jgi:cell division transport system ATP-binding protein